MQSMTPRVIVVTSRLDIGGTERHITRILPALRARGIDISLYVLERGGRLESDLIADNVAVDGPRGAWPGVLKLAIAIIDLARFLRQTRPDVVHYYLPRPYIAGSIAAELAGHRCRIMSRRSLATYRERHPVLGRVEKWLHRRTSVLLGNSNAVVTQLADEVGIRSKIGLIHNGIDLPEPVADSERQSARLALGLADNACVIAIIANLLPYKGHADLLDALASIKNEIPRPWVLLVVGRDGGIGSALVTRADDLQVAANIRWLGERRDVGLVLQAADMVVMASHEEGFSNALLEAMSYGVATITTTVGGNTDAVVNNETGLLVAPQAPDAMGSAILRLAKSQELRQRLGRAARDRVAQRYSLEMCVARYERLYRNLSDLSSRPVEDVLDGDSGNDAAIPAESPKS